MKTINVVRSMLLIALLILCNSSQARYLQADRLDVLGRNYDPALLVGVGKGVYRLPKQIQINHLYSYVDQNPVNWSDPMGLCPMCVPAAWGLGQIIVDAVALSLGAAALNSSNSSDGTSAGTNMGTGGGDDCGCWKILEEAPYGWNGDIIEQRYRKCLRECNECKK